MDKKYLTTGACIYLAYFTYGMQAIVISQHSSRFMAQWNTDLASIMSVIAWTGLAKFLTVGISGEISDRIGRRPMIVLGALSYVVFFGGLVYTTSYTMACMLAFLGGAATSLFDGASYPALQESFPETPGSALVLVKGFISISGIFYPLFIGLLQSSPLWSLALWVPLGTSLVVLVLALIAPFSYDTEMKENKGKKTLSTTEAQETAASLAKFKTRPSVAIEGVICVSYGFVSMMTFYLIQQCITIYGKDVIGMTDMGSRALMTYYTIGSLVAVVAAAFVMARGVRTITVLLAFTAGSFVSLLLMVAIRTPMVTILTSFAIGFFAAGGAMQSGIALMGEYFPGKKGRNLGIYYTFMGLASYAGPALSAKFIAASTVGLTAGTEAYMTAQAVGKLNIMYFDLAVAAVGFVMMLVVATRFKGIFGESPLSRTAVAKK